MNTTIIKSVRVALLVLCSFSLPACAESRPDVPEVAANVSDIGLLRTAHGLLRYVRFNTESDYPCLRLEVIQPEQGWRVSARRDICGIETVDGTEIGFADDLAFVEFTGLALGEAGFRFTVGYMPRTGSGEYQSQCELPVVKGRIAAGAQCSEAVRL